MNFQGIAFTPSKVQNDFRPVSDEIKTSRTKVENSTVVLDQAADDSSTSAVQPEELLQNIKALTNDGTYSVHFELHDQTNELIINLINSKTGEVIRQVPPEEIVGAHQRLTELRGNIVEMSR